MPITASVGALSYPRSDTDTDLDYWYLETNQNAIFNNFVDGLESAFAVGQDSSNGEALYVMIDGYAGYPQIRHQSNQYADQSGGSTDGIYRGAFFSNPNVYSYGTFASVGSVSQRAVLYPTNYFTGSGPSPSTQIVNFPPYLTASQNLTTICSIVPGIGGGWVLYRDYSRLIYRQVDWVNWNVVGPNTVVNTLAEPVDYVPQNISKFSNGDGLVSLNLGTNGKGGGASVNKIRRVNKNYNNATYDYYPTIWERSYSHGTIYDQFIKDDNVYFVSSSENAGGDIAALDSSGGTRWSTRIADVFLTGIDIYSRSGVDYLYVSGFTTSGNLYIALYDLNGVQQWQNELSGANFTDSKIQTNFPGTTVIGNADSYGFALIVPRDGSIPRATFDLKGTTYTYATSSKTESTGGSFSSTTPSDAGLALFGNNTLNTDQNLSNYTLSVSSLDA